MNYILERLQESSTWRGLINAAAGIAGLQFSESFATQIVAAGVAVAGLLAMVMKDKLGSQA